MVNVYLRGSKVLTVDQLLTAGWLMTEKEAMFDLRCVVAVLWLNFFQLVLIYMLRSHETQAHITKILFWLHMTGLHLACVRWVMVWACNKTLHLSVAFYDPRSDLCLMDVGVLQSPIWAMYTLDYGVVCWIELTRNPARCTSVTDLTIARLTHQ